jgi:integrase
VDVLKAWKRQQADGRLALGPGYRDHGLVFAKVDGTPIHPERFSREFDRRVERWGLPKLTVHGLRHTWATLALQAGVQPKVVQERLGHSVIAVTLRVYSHVTPTLHAELPTSSQASSSADAYAITIG